MNHIRVTVLAGVLTIGSLGLFTSYAHAQVPGSAAPATASRYYNGWGYYYYPTVRTAPTYRGGFYSAPARNYSQSTSTSRSGHDYTGRHDGLIRPWLRPLQ
jgi:hypothetical protein